MSHVDHRQHVVVDGLVLAGDERAAVEDEVDLRGSLLQRF